MSIERILLLIPSVLLLLYAVLKAIAKRTRTKCDDKADEFIGDVLDGLGQLPKSVSEDKNKSQDDNKDSDTKAVSDEPND